MGCPQQPQARFFEGQLTSIYRTIAVVKQTKNTLLMLLFGALALALAPAGCSSSSSSNGNKSTGGKALKTRESGTVVFEVPGRTVRVKAEVVRTPKDQIKGLMHREELCAYCGMLFIYAKLENHTFWMKNTYIPLDMVFIDGEMKVVGSVENAEPLTEVTRSIDKPSLFILEVNGGFVRKHGLEPGVKVRWEGIRE